MSLNQSEMRTACTCLAVPLVPAHVHVKLETQIGRAQAVNQNDALKLAPAAAFPVRVPVAVRLLRQGDVEFQALIDRGKLGERSTTGHIVTK